MPSQKKNSQVEVVVPVRMRESWGQCGGQKSMMARDYDKHMEKWCKVIHR